MFSGITFFGKVHRRNPQALYNAGLHFIRFTCISSMTKDEITQVSGSILYEELYKSAMINTKLEFLHLFVL